MTGQPGKFDKDKIIFFISVALILSIILNLNQYRQLGKLTQQMSQVISEVSYIRIKTQNQAQNVRSSLAEFREEQRWATPVDIHPLTGEGQESVLLTWQVKEYEEGSPVEFFYRRQGEHDFSSLAAENAGGSTFQVKLSTGSIPQEPAFRVHFTVKNPSSTNGGKKVEQSIPVKPDFDGSGYLYDYYITVRQGGQVRSTEPSRLDLGKLALYNFSPVTVQIEEDQRRGELNVSIYEEGPVEPKHRLTGAHLEVYHDKNSGDDKPTEIPLKDGKTTLRYAEREVPVYEASFQGETKSISRMVARVEYEDGQVFRHQILP
ncbi:MAG: hypothetical protein PWQ96_158 [Clostridia bacterium]|nr:hypothetical protein [Clostridia bacterium]